VGNIIAFPEIIADEEMSVWECECGSVTFHIHQSGEVTCPECEKYHPFQILDIDTPVES